MKRIEEKNVVPCETYALKYSLVYTTEGRTASTVYAVHCRCYDGNGRIVSRIEQELPEMDKSAALKFYHLVVKNVVFPEHICDLYSDLFSVPAA